MEVYKAINKVQSELAAIGLAKDRRNTMQNYNFRGIDDVYNVLSPLLAKHGLCILPRVLTRDVTTHITPKGGTLFYVAVEVEFDFVASSDGSKHVVKTFGEAMDSGDKATNKAMSAAYKYAAFQAFAIHRRRQRCRRTHARSCCAKTKSSTSTRKTESKADRAYHRAD